MIYFQIDRIKDQLSKMTNSSTGKRHGRGEVKCRAQQHMEENDNQIIQKNKWRGVS